MALKVDDFDPVSNNDLREFWRRYPDRDVRRLILEVVRARRVMDRALGEAQRIYHGAREGNQGQVSSAATALAERLSAEKTRLGAHGGVVVKMPDTQYREP
jgi:hypothetical protein